MIGYLTIPIYHIEVNPCFYFVTYLLYPNKIYGELEQMAVDEVIGRLQAGG